MGDEQGEASARVRAAYARRAARGLDDRYAYWESANLFIYQSRERALAEALRDAGLLPLAERRVLDAGCGDGNVLRDLLRLGASEDALYGLDLLPDRVAQAREKLPRARIDVADAQRLPYEDGAFDLVLGFTLLSSLPDQASRRRVAGEMRRVTKPGGAIVVYDFWINPLNRDAHPLRRSAIRALFPSCPVDFYGTTLAPPLVRALIGAPGGRLACTALEMIPFLRTHYVAAIRA